jgi:hypothetical protein
MQDVVDAFEKLERELQQHIEQLGVRQFEQAAAEIGLRSNGCVKILETSLLLRSSRRGRANRIFGAIHSGR